MPIAVGVTAGATIAAARLGRARHKLGARGAIVIDAQSLLWLHMSPSWQFGQLPPQSMSDSSPSIMPFSQVSGTSVVDSLPLAEASAAVASASSVVSPLVVLCELWDAALVPLCVNDETVPSVSDALELSRALAILDAKGIEDGNAAEARFILARAQLDAGDRERAQASAERALDTARRAGPVGADIVVAIEKWQREDGGSSE